MKKLLSILITTLITIVSLVIAPASAQAAASKPDDKMVLGNYPDCSSKDPYRVCATTFMIRSSADIAEVPTLDLSTWSLKNAAGKVVSSDYSNFDYGYGTYHEPYGFLDKSYRGLSYGNAFFDDNSSFEILPNDRYTLTVNWKYRTSDDKLVCGDNWYFRWNGTYGYWSNCRSEPADEPSRMVNYGKTTYRFNWSGKKMVVSPDQYKGSSKQKATTSTTYTAKKSYVHTATATYKASEQATYTYRGKKFRATAVVAVKKTSTVKKQGTYKVVKLKRSATATATATNIYSQKSADKLAQSKALRAAQSAATASAKNHAIDKAVARAKASVSTADKSKASKAAKRKLTAEVKTKAHKDAKAAALKAAKKKAGIQ